MSNDKLLLSFDYKIPPEISNDKNQLPNKPVFPRMESFGQNPKFKKC
jgi:hypothetical protein